MHNLKASAKADICPFYLCYFITGECHLRIFLSCLPELATGGVFEIRLVGTSNITTPGGSTSPLTSQETANRFRIASRKHMHYYHAVASLRCFPLSKTQNSSRIQSHIYTRWVRTRLHCFIILRFYIYIFVLMF